MQKGFAVAAALGCVLASTAALAAGPVSAGPTCDFFQAQLIGVLCGRTAFVGLDVQGTDLTVKRTTLFQGVGTTVQRWEYRSTYEIGTLAISPWDGVRFHVSGEAFQYDNNYSGSFAPLGGGFGAPVTAHASGDIAGWQSAGAEVTVWDRTTDQGRYVVSLIGNVAMFPGDGNYNARQMEQVGWQSGARWNLGRSGLSLDYFAQNHFVRIDNPGVLDFESNSRLMLASDAYGVAAGPVLTTANVLSHAGGYNTGWSAARLGGQILIEPFRNTKLTVLRDMTVDATAAHSIGQAGLIPGWAGSANAIDYSVGARFNFRY